MNKSTNKPATLRLKRSDELKYTGTLGSEPITLAFSTGCEEGWSIQIRGEWHWLATSYKVARVEAVARFGTVAK